MRDTLSHRGPDGFGTRQLENGRVALGHRRLSIIDLTEAGNQPMSNEDGTVWITFNGEVYNYQILRNVLLNQGHIFRSNCDTEVIIHGYEEWGVEVFSKLKGMFALAIYDTKQKKIVLARDRFGIKPLYYTWQNNNFIFASELKAIVKAAEFEKNIDYTSALDFFVYRFIPTPKTIYKDTWKLEPASYLEFPIDKKPLAPVKYWALDIQQEDEKNEDVVSKFDMMLENAVQEHLVSDVPVGVFLSGGYDSTTMVYYMHKLNYAVQSFSIGFQDWPKSEHTSARIVAEIFHTSHSEKILDDEKIDTVSFLTHYYDEPQGGSSFMPTYEVSKLAQEKVKVVLSGDGGDELLAGYEWHRKLLNGYVDYSASKSSAMNWSTDDLLKKYHAGLSWTGLTYIETNRLFNEKISQRDLPEDLWVYRQKLTKADRLKSIQKLDIDTYMLDVFLPKVDRASMANSIEVRVPFLDHALFEYIFRLPSKTYFDPAVNKILLNKILSRKLPAEILNKPKQGFSSPLNKASEIHKIIAKITNGRLIKENVINKNIVDDYVKNKSIHKLWAIYIFENWYDRWM